MSITAPRDTGGAGRVLRALLVVWFAAPLLPLLLWSVADRWPFPARLPQEWGWAGAQTAADSGAGSAFVTSTAVALTVAAIATPVGAAAGWALARGRVPAPRLTYAVLMAPLVFPAFAISLGLDVVVLRSRIPAQLAVVVILAVLAIPYTTTVMRLGFAAHGADHEDQARLLGARRWTVFSRVTLPMMARPLATATFLAFLTGWSDYVVTLLVGGGQLRTIPILVASYAAGVGNDSVVAVLSVTAIIPPLALLVAVGGLRRVGAR
ncbi:ABC transporter permease [Williamsia sp. CHRR-6]|uniref:ABC transporter permease n=1 Tax=Williamsia sp. CHRR-6 TaxID=2835871 RepID=UPI001BDA5205|nr:ABC transporter permease subunit [Williamsia sp. CHRR-6]MBT0566619.1 ABC transporter permease subunit [Williamsia sp. CHRR-6]